MRYEATKVIAVPEVIQRWCRVTGRPCITLNEDPTGRCREKSSSRSSGRSSSETPGSPKELLLLLSRRPVPPRFAYFRVDFTNKSPHFV